MKRIFIGMIFLSSMTAMAQDVCPFKVIESTSTVASLPIYEAKATYYFDDKDKTASAIVHWNLNPEVTRKCFENNQNLFPQHKVIIPSVRVSELEVSVLKGLHQDKLVLYPEAGGHFHGSTDMIKVDYRAKEIIKEGISRGKDMVKIIGDFRFSFTINEQAIIKEIPCEKGLNLGVINLHRRLGEVIKEIEKTKPEEKVNKELVLDHFMTSCVEFIQDSSSVVGFEQNFLKRTKLKKGRIPVTGFKPSLRSEPMEPVLMQESMTLDF